MNITRAKKLSNPKKTSSEPKLLDKVKIDLRTKHYSKKTEEAYIKWIKEFIYFHNKKHPIELAKENIEKYLSDLAEKKAKILKHGIAHTFRHYISTHLLKSGYDIKTIQ